MTLPSHHPLQLYITAPYPCSYLPEQTARSQVAVPGHLVDTQVYSQLMDRGFRRSGLFTYRPHCKNCNACQTLRIPVANFTADRSQRRTLKRYARLQTRIMPPLATDEHFALYQNYLQARHADGGMDSNNLQDYEQFLLTSRVDTQLVEFREPTDTGPGPLRMVSVIDVLAQGISAVYTFYDPADRRQSFGTYSILWLIGQARRLGLPYVYLGYWIAQSPKMAYKARFRPCEVLANGRWQPLCSTAPAAS